MLGRHEKKPPQELQWLVIRRYQGDISDEWGGDFCESRRKENLMYYFLISGQQKTDMHLSQLLSIWMQTKKAFMPIDL